LIGGRELEEDEPVLAVAELVETREHGMSAAERTPENRGGRPSSKRIQTGVETGSRRAETSSG
jgi:hypothetical protein